MERVEDGAFGEANVVRVSVRYGDGVMMIGLGLVRVVANEWTLLFIYPLAFTSSFLSCFWACLLVIHVYSYTFFKT